MRFSDRIRAAYDGFTGKSETAENAAKQSETTAQHVLSHAPMIPPGLAEDIAFGDYDRRDLWAAEYNVRMVVDFVASKIAALPFHAYRVKPNGDREEAPNSEIGKLIADPSYVANETRYRLIHSLVVDMMLNDQWLMLLTMDKDYDYRLRRIPYGTYSVRYNALAEPMGVQITLPNGQVNYELPNKNVLLSLGYPGAVGNPKPMSSALGPLLTEARELASYRRFIAQNGGRIPAYIKRPAGMEWASEQARNDFIQGMRAYRKGGGKDGGWPLLEDGMDIVTLDAFKPVDMADLDARDRIGIAVCNAYHISPENVGIRTGNKSSVEAYKDQLWNVELSPYVVQLEQQLNHVIPKAVGEEDVFILANMDAQLRGTPSEQYKALSTATGRPFMSLNEGRRKLNLPAKDDGDEVIVPLNVTQGGQPSPQDGGNTQNAQTGASPNGR